MINIMKIIHIFIAFGIFLIAIAASKAVLSLLGGMLGIVCAALLLPLGVIVSLGYLALVVQGMMDEPQ